MSYWMCIWIALWSRGGLYKSVLVYEGRRGTWGLGYVYFNSKFRYCNIRTVFSFVSIDSLYIEIGTSDRRRCIDIQNVMSKIREEVWLAFLSFICLQDMIIPADFTESIKLRRSKSFARHIKTFKAIGDQFIINTEISNEQFVFVLYRFSQSSSTNKTRYKKLCSKRKLPKLEQLPPMRDALLCHIKRVNHVTWKLCSFYFYFFVKSV